MIQVPSDTAGALSSRLFLTRRGESGFALLWLFLLSPPFLCPLHLFFRLSVSSAKRKKKTAPRAQCYSAKHFKRTALVGCVCPAQACNCRPSPALLITTVIIIIAVCYPRAQATPGCSDLSSPSFLSRTLPVSCFGVQCRLVVGQRKATAADRSHHRHSLVATFITFFFSLLPFCPFAALSCLAARTIARRLFPPDRNPCCVAVSMHSIPLPIAATST